MNLGPRSILLLVAVVLFLIAALGVSAGSISLVTLGFAFFAGSFLVGDGGLGVRS